ncbi:AAA family ATPase [Alginatibacterium sediminis]|uniref:AAA family ATPase n=1 Tax=Alginatibacterium sediminis TaxID=2164068 RepID=UPI003898E368
MNPQLSQIASNIDQHLLGKSQTVRLALSCLLAGGHLLLEDVPGVGKTSLAKSLAGQFGLSFQRIQFTSDMLPADILGVSVFEAAEHAFRFHPGPIFNQLLLADELNRASPRAQSALLEAMEERQVSIDGQSYPLEQPFFVIATQNPSEQLGTFELPESQLDRFAMRLAIGFPDPKSELQMLKGISTSDVPSTSLSAAALRALQSEVGQVHASDSLLNYILRLVHLSRHTENARGLSPRASKILLSCAQAWAFIHGSDHLLPEHVQAVFVAVSSHRLASGDNGAQMAQLLLEQVDPYRELS